MQLQFQEKIKNSEETESRGFPSPKTEEPKMNSNEQEKNK